VNAQKLEDLAVEAGKLAPSSVTATKIANLAVGTAAIANAAITNAKIGNLAVDTAQIANAAIDSAKIANLAVGTAAVQDAAIVNAKINNLAVTDAKIQDVTAAKIKTGTVLATETITSEGVIRAVDDINTPTVQTGIGPATFGTATTYLMWAYNGTDRTFSVDELGNVSVTGSITIAAGSTGVANLSDAGTLAGKNSADSGDVTFNYAGSGSKGGNASDTDNVNGTASTTITSDITSALDNAQTAQDTADGKIRSFYQNAAPTGMVAGDSGDLWIDTDDGNKLYRWSGTAWIAAQDGDIGVALQDASDASTLAGTKIVTFFQAGTPTANIAGDLWYNTSDLSLKRWSGSAWVDVGDITANKTAASISEQGGLATKKLGRLGY